MAALASGKSPVTPTVVRPPVSAGALTPEAERSLRRLILGLAPNETRLFMMPETAQWDPKSNDPRVRWLRRQFYRLNFELLHGQIFRHAPPHTQFFVAVPDPRTTPESLGNEESVLREHLRERLGWPDSMIDERIRFFAVPRPVPFPQDMAEPIGYDQNGRLILGLGSDSDEWYLRAAERLAETFPKEFVIRLLPGINTEGGDLALVRLPEGDVGLLVGRNRVVRYVRRLHPEMAANAPIPEALIEEARRAYQRAFDGVETIIVGREALVDPRLDNPEIFHLDMVTAVLDTPAGPVAFVPTYAGGAVDSLSHVRLTPDAVKRFQGEYDRTALQMAARGYRVARVPFADQPTRSPVGIAKFVDPVTGRSTVILGRYPDHLADADERNAQTQLQIVFERLDDAVAAWRHAPTDVHWKAVQSAAGAAWRQMDASVASPNATYQGARKVFESYGVDVVELPIYPTGEGGIHCLLLK